MKIGAIQFRMASLKIQMNNNKIRHVNIFLKTPGNNKNIIF